MLLGAKPEGLLERIGLWLGMVPVPVGFAMFGMTTSRGVMAGVRLGVFAELAKGPVRPSELAARLKLDPAGTERLLELLEGLRLLRRRGDAFTLEKSARKWLDPSSRSYVGGFIDFNYAQWDWWSNLEKMLQTGKAEEIHAYPPEDPRWRGYIVAMYELARLAAPEVARAVPLPKKPRRLLDVAGAHGWFAAELCLRHPGLSATVLDLPGSARVGRELIAQAGLSDRVTHVEGDLAVDDLGGPYDGALAFQIIHHLSPEQNAALLERLAQAVAPGGTVAILDYFQSGTGKPTAMASALALHYFVTSSATTYRLSEVRGWLERAGFTQVRATAIHRLPSQTLVTARRR